MSGPKIVRVVTPKERRMIKQKWLTHLRTKINSLKEYASENNVIDEKLNTALEETFDHYQNLSEDAYEKIEQEVPAQIEYLESEKKNLFKKVVKKRTSIWESYTNLRSTHNELRTLLKQKNIEFEDFKEPLVIIEDQIENYRKKVDQLYTVFKGSYIEEPQLTKLQLEIQQRLSAGDSLLSVEEWRKQHPTAVTRIKKLENTLKEMFVTDISQDKIQEFIRRCNELDTGNPNYPLLIDSLTIEAATYYKNQLALQSKREALNLLITQIEDLGVEAKFINLWKELIKSGELVELQDTLEKASQFYEKESEKIMVEARREAIINALEKAGYKVNDSMETAWVENGRLVVKKAPDSLYGVEFMSPKNLSRIQARVVADEDRTNERTPNLDKNQEEKWCNEFEEIRSILSSENLTIHIDKAQNPGVVKLKEVSLNKGYNKSGAQNTKGKGFNK